MLDPAVGSAGVVTLVMYFAGMIIVFNIGFGSNLAVFTSIITAEVVAKYVMVLLANRGISAWEGFSSPFCGDEGQYALIYGYHNDCNCMVCHQLHGFIALIISIVLAQFLKYISSKSFGGLSGDLLGASNEIARLSSYCSIISIVNASGEMGFLINYNVRWQSKQNARRVIEKPLLK